MTTEELSKLQAELSVKDNLTDDEVAELYAIDAMLDARCE